MTFGNKNTWIGYQNGYHEGLRTLGNPLLSCVLRILDNGIRIPSVALEGGLESHYKRLSGLFFISFLI